MAWADTRLEREEILAVQAAGRVLKLPEDAIEALDAGPPPIARVLSAPLAEEDKRIVYGCAAWLARVDDHEGSGETDLLRELAEGLGLDAETARRLREGARDLHSTTPGSTPWWQELETLVERVAATLI